MTSFNQSIVFEVGKYLSWLYTLVEYWRSNTRTPGADPNNHSVPIKYPTRSTPIEKVLSLTHFGTLMYKYLIDWLSYKYQLIMMQTHGMFTLQFYPTP